MVWLEKGRGTRTGGNLRLKPNRLPLHCSGHLLVSLYILMCGVNVVRTNSF